MIQIGSHDWHEALLERSKSLGGEFWADFRPVTTPEIDSIEIQIGRQLDSEFKAFYEAIGYGSFPGGGNIYSPQDILACVPNPIFFVCGSLFSSEAWATEEEHRKMWMTRGRFNPAPERFTSDALQLHGIFLYDLLQFGSDGACCYHQLYVGPEPAPIRYCLLTPEGNAEDLLPSFSAASEGIIRRVEDWKNEC